MRSDFSLNRAISDGNLINYSEFVVVANRYIQPYSRHSWPRGVFFAGYRFFLFLLDKFRLKHFLKVTVNTIVPRSPFFAFWTPKYRLLGRFLWEQNLVQKS